MLHEPDSLFGDLERALAGRYVLERRLGRGGMGIVYLAHEVRLNRRVAIKLLPPDKAADSVARERFIQEAQTAGRLSHPHIVPIHAVDQIGDFVFFAMGYVEGQTLGERIRAQGPLDVAEGVRMLREIASALDYAHERGVVHRDVKPDNILVDTLTGRPHVSDFGIARVEGSGNTGPREVVGTAEFMSPEQARGASVDARSDLYSLGVVGYYVLSGRLPFEARDSHALLMRHIAHAPPPLASVAPQVRRRVAQVIDRCLAKDPTDRFASGAEFAAALAQSVAARETPPLEVRAFLAESRHLSAPSLVYAVFAGLALPLLALTMTTMQGTLTGSALWAGAIGIALTPLAFMYLRVRRLRAAGFDDQDLTDALRAELRRRREEISFLYGAGTLPLERVLRIATHSGLAGAAVVTGVVAGSSTLVPVETLAPAFGTFCVVACFAAIAARARTEHRTDPKGERRLRFWRGPFGRALFWLAGLGLGRGDKRPGKGAAPVSPDLGVGILGERFFEARAPNTT